MADAAWYIDRLHAEFQRLSADSPKPLFTIRLRCALVRGTDLVKSRMRRWGWEFLYVSNGLNLIKDRVEVAEKIKFHSLLDAARSSRESENVAEHAGADRLPDEAIRLGIEPTLTSEEGEREFAPRHDDWWMIPALGEGRPKFSIDEHGDWARQSMKLRARSATKSRWRNSERMMIPIDRPMRVKRKPKSTFLVSRVGGDGCVGNRRE
jgi:hypothetical protein